MLRCVKSKAAEEQHIMRLACQSDVLQLELQRSNDKLFATQPSSAQQSRAVSRFNAIFVPASCCKHMNTGSLEVKAH